MGEKKGFFKKLVEGLTKTRVYTSDECRNRYFELFGKKGTYDLNAAGVVNGTKVYQRLLIRRVTKEQKQ